MTESLTSTQALLDRAREGDDLARDRLYARLLPGLRRWARGRVPRGARDLTDTDDLVQIALARSLSRLETFESRGPGSFRGYLHLILTNLVRDEYRRAQRRPESEELTDDRGVELEQTLGIETRAAYEKALDQLTDGQRDAIVLRLEYGFTFPEIATALGKPSPNAARMLVMRGLVRMAEWMDEPV